MLTKQTIRYGAAAAQEGDLHLPAASRPPVVCLLHGGFWRMPYDRHQMDSIARDLGLRGFAVWNLEYRRLGVPGAGWPGTMDDVASGIDHLAQLVADGADLDLDRVVVAGHSAADEVVPVELSRRYVRAAAAAGDDIELVELPDTGHMDFLDPASDAHATLRRWLEETTKAS